MPINFKHLDTFDPLSVPTVPSRIIQPLKCTLKCRFHFPSDLRQQLDKIGGEEKSHRLSKEILNIGGGGGGVAGSFPWWSLSISPL